MKESRKRRRGGRAKKSWDMRNISLTRVITWWMDMERIYMWKNLLYLRGKFINIMMSVKWMFHTFIAHKKFSGEFQHPRRDSRSPENELWTLKMKRKSDGGKKNSKVEDERRNEESKHFNFFNWIKRWLNRRLFRRFLIFLSHWRCYFH